MKIANNLIELTGNTPLVKINKLNNSGANVIAKLEYYNPWDYERNIHNFLKFEDFYCLPKSIIKFSNIIIKGKIDPVQLKFVENKNKVKYSGYRNLMSIKETLFFQLKYILFYFTRNFLPKRLFTRLRQLKNKS